jgi:hypothetical protein
VGEKRDKQLKELKDQVVAKHPNGSLHDYNSDDGKHNFWESQGFKFVASMSMLALVILTKR